jgi:protein-tyrosine phosphatase
VNRGSGLGPGRFGSEAITEIESRGIVRLNVPIPDTTPPEDDAFARAIAFLQAADDLPNSRLYVHCRYGRERTGTILMAWQALRNGTDGETALAALNAAGARLTPLPHQRLQAELWLVRHRAGI